MRKRLLITSSLALLLGLGVAGGLSLAKNETKPVEAATTYWYYRGNGKGLSWDSGSDTYRIVIGETSKNWPFTANEEFKFYSAKTGWSGSTYGINSISGSASWAFQKTGGNEDNLKCNTAGNYDVTVTSSGILYVDYADNTNFYYIGSDTAKSGSNWNHNYTDAPIPVNSSTPTQLTFAANEEFKVRMSTSWDNGVLAFSDLKDNDTFYGSFQNNSGNIKCKLAATYTLSVQIVNHAAKLIIHGAVDNKVYVLDLYGNLLNTTHKAYVWNANGNNGWPGADMGVTAGASNIYEFTYWEKLTSIIFNQGDNAGKTIDLTPQNGKCLLLTGETNAEWKWSSNTWYEFEVAKFVANYMKFETYRPEDSGDGKCASQGWYTAAKNAYQASSFAPYRQELCSIAIVVERLQAWAAANGDTFTITNNVGSFSAHKNVLIGVSQVTDNSTILIVVASVLALAGVGGYFFFRRKKAQ